LKFLMTNMMNRLYETTYEDKNIFLSCLPVDEFYRFELLPSSFSKHFTL